jgi:hypothetical protein
MRASAIQNDAWVEQITTEQIYSYRTWSGATLSELKGKDLVQLLAIGTLGSIGTLAR